MENRQRYSDSDLQEFKEIILKKIEKAEKDLALINEILSKEQNAILAGRQEKFIRDLKHALIRIENKTYGICRVTGKLIDKERLKAVPHATLSIEAKKMQR